MRVENQLPVLDKNVEIPSPPYTNKWHFANFEIGDSRAIPVEDNQLEATRFRVAASAYGKRNNRTYLSRTTYENGKGKPGKIKMLRIWRTL